MASLVAALDGLRSAHTRWVVVSGEPGTGKTRLLAELCAGAEARGYAVLVGRGAEMERGEGAPGIRLLQDAFHMRSLSLYETLGFDVKEPLR